MLLLVVVALVLLWAVLSFGFQFSFAVGFLIGFRFEVEEDLFSEVRGQRCWVGGVHGVLLGCMGCLCGGRAPPLAWRPAAALALAVALWMRLAEKGRSEEVMEDVNEDEDEEEVVVFLGCGLRCHAGGCGFLGCGGLRRCHGGEDGGLLDGAGASGGGAAATWRPGSPIRSAAVGGGGAGLRSPPFRHGWAELLQCVRACMSVSTGGNSLRGLHSGAGGTGPGVLGGVCGGRVRVTGRVGCAVGRAAPRSWCVWVAGCGGR